MAPTKPMKSLEDVEPAVTTPIDATKSDTRVVATSFLLQLVAVVGILIGFLGLAEESLIVRVYRLVLTEQGFVLVSFVAGIVAWGYDLVRKMRRNRQLQVLSLLPNVPNSVAIGPENPSASVERAVAVATQTLDRQGDYL